MTTTPNFGLTLLEAAQAQKEVTINEAFAVLDVFLKGSVLDKDLATPPGSPASGAAYIVAASPTGAWAGQAKAIAYFDQIWHFIAPRSGMRVRVSDEQAYYEYSGSSWVMDGGVASYTSLTVTNPITGSVSGNAATATKLATARTINGVAFDGTANITVGGDLTGEVTTSGSVATLSNSAVIGKVLTGYTSGAGTVASGDSLLQAIQKLDGNSASKAGLASPSFTGTPTAPTASVGTSTTQIATTAFVAGALPAAQDFRLTLTSGVPVTTTDVTAASTIYCTPYGGNKIALYDGTKWIVRSSAEFSLALSGLTSGKPYDVFCYDSSGTPTLECLVWTNDTTRATALTTQDGVFVKSGATTRRYMGTFYTTGTTTTEDSAVKRYLWNFYHRRPRVIARYDNSGGHTYTTAVWRQVNADTANQIDVVAGVAADTINASCYARVSNSNANVAIRTGIGINSTSAVSSDCIVGSWYSQSANVNMAVYASINTQAPLGKTSVTWLQYSAASGSTSWSTGSADASAYSGGLHGIWHA